ncbi:GlxA family transcriptional regulator [Nocardiopsis sp. MG754419]|uniref:GlxA family transcriptional regulator n=1 Tax=Nocardiopsis sp. MG754419 TaxID=2259865 RepID=UPI001BA70745|nr:helix-turn-helix domain-containing protein [Nocardiopsis sp. MG754419]
MEQAIVGARGLRPVVVGILAMPRLYALDVTIPAHVLGRHPGYRVIVCGDGEGPGSRGADATSTEAVVTEVRATHTLDDAARADIVLVPGYEGPYLPVPEPFLRTLRTADEHGARIIGLCTGVFALAEAGLLRGRSATIHWRYSEELRAASPDTEVIENRRLVEDGPLLTSAGATAGVDACLHLIETDFGTVAADGAAREVVTAPARDAAEPQYSTARADSREDLRATLDWVSAHLGAPITVAALAERSRMSRRTFIRHFTRETGMPPMRWVVRQRIVGARRLLETGDRSIERIAQETGFGTSANFRATFRREVGVSPSAYRTLRATDASPDEVRGADRVDPSARRPAPAGSVDGPA